MTVRNDVFVVFHLVKRVLQQIVGQQVLHHPVQLPVVPRLRETAIDNLFRESQPNGGHLLALAGFIGPTRPIKVRTVQRQRTIRRHRIRSSLSECHQLPHRQARDKHLGPPGNQHPIAKGAPGNCPKARRNSTPFISGIT